MELYGCNCCGIVFTQLNYLIQHFKKEHKESMKIPTIEWYKVIETLDFTN